MAMLEIQNVDKVYRSRGKAPVHAVRALDMAVKKGEIVALLGSSGCGKTSTLRMIAGFESVSSGAIALSQRRIDELPPAKRGVAMAFEGYSLYPPLTVRENIAFALKAQQLSRGEIIAPRRSDRAAGRDRRHSRQLSAHHLGRAAAARLARACPGARRRPLSARRADGTARAAAARGAARPDQGPARGARHDGDLRHP